MRLAPPIACQDIIDWTYRQSGAISEQATIPEALPSFEGRFKRQLATIADAPSAFRHADD
jgi:hypothetical protein